VNGLKTVVVVAAIIERDGRILLARRDAQSSQAGMWEFPGGKVESGETQPEALRRELLEELGIEAEIDQWIASNDWQQAERIIELHAWRVGDFRGEITLHCHSDVRWVLPQEALEFALAPADIPLLDAYITQLSSP
jgi:(d)CTP diphosphatase